MAVKWAWALALLLRMGSAHAVEFYLSDPVVVPATVYAPDHDPEKTVRPNYAELFEEFDSRLNNGDALSRCDNTSGILAWGQSYMQLAYVSMYKATSNTRYLDKLVTQFDRVLEKRDDRLNRVDFYRQKPRKGWGCSNYDKQGRWHVFAVHTGMICQGPAEFVRLVKTDPALASKYGKTADRYLAELRAIVEDANHDYRTSGTMGYFVDPGVGDGGIVPLNMSNAMGSVIVELYRTTKDAAYEKQATQLASFFRACLEEDKSGNAWTWEYWPKNPGQPVTKGEDISHAAINVNFASRCFNAGIVFNWRDMDKFASTWQIVVMDGTIQEPVYADFVDGRDSPETNYNPQAAGRWVVPILTAVRPHRYRAVFNSLAKAFSGEEITRPSQALGLANLALAEPSPL